MPSRAHVTLVAAALGSLVLLTGCQKPTPNVTISSGSHGSVNAPATIWCFPGQQLTQQKDTCRHGGRATPPGLKATDGDRIAINVDSTVADRGWLVAIDNGQSQPVRVTSVEHDHFASIEVSPQYFGQGTSFELDVFAVSPASPVNGSASGVWRFRITHT